jgi:outer membrane protein assembly factor BamB
VPPGANGGGIIGQVSVDPAAGLAYVATGAPYAALPGSNPGTCSLLALRLRDGSVAWADQVHAGDARGFDLNSAPLLLGRRLFVTAKDGVYAWDRVRRRRLWHTQLTEPLPGGAASAGPTAGPEGGPVASDGRRLFALSNDGESFGCVAAALAPADGRVLWRAVLPALCFGAPALAGGRLHVSGSDGVLRVLDARDGRLVGSAELGEPSAAPVAVGAGRLLVGTGAGPYLPGSSLVCLG